MPRNKRSLYELRGYAERGGYVYALLFSNGIVQVGRTDNARECITARRRELRASGLDLADWWVSAPHGEWVANERRLAETCAAVGRRTGQGCYEGIDFILLTGKAHDLPATSTGVYADIRRQRRRESPEQRDRRMAVAARYRAEGMSVREIARRQSVSHTTVENDLARWERVHDQMPLEIIRLSRAGGKQGRQTDPAEGVCLPGEVASAGEVVPFRRPA